MLKTVVPTLCRSGSKFLALLLFLMLPLAGCVHGQPMEEWAYAYTAVEAARQVQANRFAPGLWFKADESYKRAQKLYEDRDYEEAKREFVKARAFAERAENTTRLKRFQTSEVL